MAVEESTTGTMTEAEGSSTPEAEVGTPGTASKVSPKEEKVEEEAKIYSQKELDYLLQVGSSEDGRIKVELQGNLDEANKRITDVETDVVDIQEERDSIQKELDDMASGDPQKWEIVSKRKELTKIEGDLKKATADLSSEKKANDGIVTSAKETMLEIDIWEIATEFKGSDPVRLKNLLAKTTINTKEGIREFAGNLWEKTEVKAPEGEKEGEEKEVKEKLNLDSGSTRGGVGEKTDQEKLDDRYPNTKWGTK